MQSDGGEQSAGNATVPVTSPGKTKGSKRMLFDDAEVISRYTRKEALEDGVLVGSLRARKRSRF